MDITEPTKTRPVQRRTTLSLTPELWDWLRAIERETGCRPSVTVRRILQRERDRRHRAPSSPAA